MFLSKIYAEAKESAVAAFIVTIVAALVMSSWGLFLSLGPNMFGEFMFVTTLLLIFLCALIFCGPEKLVVGEEEFWPKIFVSLFIMMLLFFGFGFGLLHGLYSPLKTYWPYALGAILLAEEGLYWLDDSQVGNIIPLTTNKYVFTVQKKLEAFFEIFLFLGAVGVADAAPAAFSKIVTVLSDALIVIGAILLIAAFIWLNSLKWKKPAAIQTNSQDQDHSTR